jgi:sugar phosphate isomerase/epimerase
MTAAEHGKLIGMSLLAGREDLEDAAAAVKALGFDGMEVHASQLGPGLPGVTTYEAHAAAGGEVVRRAGLFVSTLNVVGDDSFHPFGGEDAFERTVAGLAGHMRWAAAMGAPRVLIWEGRVERPEDVAAAAATLARAIEAAGRRSGLASPPPVSCELHPFTFALRHQALPTLARALAPVGAGICLDTCHFAVALGRDVAAHLDAEVVAAVNHIHYADSDARTSELHFPPGEGVLDLDAIAAKVAGRPLAIAWDLFGWPGARAAVRARMATYRAFVERHAGSVRA